MSPLSTVQLFARAANHEPVFVVWFKPEVERQPETAWQVRSQGYHVGSIKERHGRLRKGTSRRYVAVFSQFVNENQDITDGVEIDGHGFVFFFACEEDKEKYVTHRRLQFYSERQSLLRAVQQSFGHNNKT